jgi:23S rRNA pseudouridine1911/1915/1917 synthase
MSVWGGLYSPRKEITARKAITSVKILERLGPCTLVEVFPLTGRTHQIRVHLSYMGYPILGDTTYGGSKCLKAGSLSLEVPRQMLHAQSIGLTHPQTGIEMEFKVPLPDDMNKIIEALRGL